MMPEQNPNEAQQAEQGSASLSNFSAADIGKVFDIVQSHETPLKPTTLAERQEETRGELAKRLIAILQWVVIFLLLLTVVDRIAAGIFAFNGRKYEYNHTESKDIATLVLTSLSGLVGTALGFYFGSRSSLSNSDKDK